MEVIFPFLILLANPYIITFILIFVVILVIKKIIANRKINGFIDYCKRNKLEYNDKLSEYSDRYLAIKDSLYFKSFGSPQFLYEMSGNSTNGVEFSIFTYKYYDGNEGNCHTYETICIFNKKGVSLPDFFMINHYGIIFDGAVANFVGNTIKSVGQGIIDLESKFSNISNKDLYSAKRMEFKDDKKFSDNFDVYSDDEETRKLFNSNARRILLSKNHFFYMFYTVNDYFIVIKPGFLNIESRIEFLKHSQKVFEALITSH